MSDGSGVAPKGVKFLLDGVEVEALRARRSGARRGATRPTFRISASRRHPAIAPTAIGRACMVEIEGERVLAASCIRQPSPGMKVQTQSERAVANRKLVFELLSPISRRARKRMIPIPNSGRTRRASASRQAAFAARYQPAPDRSPSGDGGQSRCLHSMQSLRPRLPRSAGQ